MVIKLQNRRQSTEGNLYFRELLFSSIFFVAEIKTLQLIFKIFPDKVHTLFKLFNSAHIIIVNDNALSFNNIIVKKNLPTAFFEKNIRFVPLNVGGRIWFLCLLCTHRLYKICRELDPQITHTSGHN